MESTAGKISVWGKMGESILSNDIYILFFAFLTIALIIAVMVFAGQVDDQINNHRKETTERFAGHLSEWLSIFYNLFTTMITIFPLLGMFGTVGALISINIISGDHTGFQQNFFSALTSTAWGIVFPILFKIVNAVIEHRVLTTIEAAEEIKEAEKQREAGKSRKKGAAEGEETEGEETEEGAEA